jgi:hypothetical protein
VVTDRERRFVTWMLRLGLFDVKRSIFGLWDIYARPGARWILKWLKERQVVDNLHHAPACRANHFHKCRLVFDPCGCGAAAADGGVKP